MWKILRQIFCWHVWYVEYKERYGAEIHVYYRCNKCDTTKVEHG